MKNTTAKILRINVMVLIIGVVLMDFALGYFLIPYKYNHFRIQHPYYHHGLAPNTDQYAAWGKHLYPFSTNSLGMRDHESRYISPEKNNKRILILGDSHSEGVGVEFRHSFAGILQNRTRTLEMEILNASAVSYSPKIHFLKANYLLNKTKLELDEIWIFIDISDLQNEIAYESFSPVEPDWNRGSKTFSSKLFSGHSLRHTFSKFFEKYSFTFYTIHSFKDTKRVNAFVSKMNEFDPSKTNLLQKNTVELYEDFFRDFDNDDMLRNPEFHGVGEWYYNPETMPLAQKGLELGMNNISKLDSLCKSKGIKLVLAVHPWHSQILEQKSEDYYVFRWKQFCDEHGIEFLNMFTIFINHENPYSVIKRYYIPNDNHWNEEGHKKVADFLENQLIKKDVAYQ